MTVSSGWAGKTLGVIGGGNMAEALVRGVIAAGLLPVSAISVYDLLPERRAVFAALGCRAAESPGAAAGADVILLATKPKDAAAAAAGLAGVSGRLVVSILAGVTTAALEALLPSASRIVRVMPNTPLLVGKGLAGLAGGSSATSADTVMVRELFACAGEAEVVAEADLDAVTALSGSGPAYVFRFAEALTAAGVELGLPAALAGRLAIGTIAGAAEMLARDSDAAELRRKVTSPGGTTAAALAVLESGDFGGLVSRALCAARDRSAEMRRG